MAPRPPFPGHSFRELVREKLPLLLVAALIACLTIRTRDDHGSLVSLDTIPLSARAANALTAYGWYLAATFCPWRLAVLYPHPGTNWSPLAALAGAAVLVSITVLVRVQTRRRPWLICGWLWFVGVLVPVIGLAQGGAQAWADRFTYWPHIGLFVALVWGGAELASSLRFPVVVSGLVAAGVVVGLGVLTWVQVGYWRNSVTLWEHTVAVTKDNDRAQESLSRCYRKQGRIAEAESHLLEAGRIQTERLRRMDGQHYHRNVAPAEPTGQGG
jgi:hypothetical protein